MMSAWLYAVTGNLVQAQKVLDELLERSHTEFISVLSLAVTAYYSDNREQAFRFMEQAFDERTGLLAAISGYPFLALLKTDPAFQPFVERMHYPPEHITNAG
jgi:hypothetical protein